MKSALVLAVVAQKGGVGKSTLVRSIAVEGILRGRRVAIIDADTEQYTTHKWTLRRSEQVPEVVPLENRTIADVVAGLTSRRAELIVIDTPPHSRPLINVAAEAADAALIVTQPYQDDVQEVGRTAAILDHLGKRGGVVLNNAPSRAAALALGRAALAAVAFPTCPTAITHLMSHPYASAEGLTAQEREPTGKAAREIAEVWDWFFSKILVQ